MSSALSKSADSNLGEFGRRQKPLVHSVGGVGGQKLSDKTSVDHHEWMAIAASFEKV